MVIDVSERDFEERVLKASREVPVIVDFWAGWCRPCLVLGPILEGLAHEHEGRFVLAKLDVDANQELAARYGIQGIPAVKAFRDGEVVSEFVGAQPEDAVRLWLREVLPSEAEPIVAEAAGLEETGDPERAEGAYRRALEIDPDHEEATVGLARVLLARGEAAEAGRVASRLPGSVEARAIAARAALVERIPGDGDLDDLRARAETDPEAALAVAAADAERGQTSEALDRLLGLVAGEMRDRARDLMVTIFESLGDDHPLVREYRPRLASALY
ncbi:MAG TPA: tetratricopeptide repeat protein [Actinomycetota bacterium]